MCTEYTSFTIKFEDVAPVRAPGIPGSVHPELFLPLKVVPSWWRGLCLCLFLRRCFSDSNISPPRRKAVYRTTLHTFFLDWLS